MKLHRTAITTKLGVAVGRRTHPADRRRPACSAESKPAFPKGPVAAVGCRMHIVTGLGGANELRPCTLYVRRRRSDDDGKLCRSLSRLLRAAGMQPIAYTSAGSVPRRSETPLTSTSLVPRRASWWDVRHRTGRRLHAEAARAFIFFHRPRDPDTRARAEAAGCAAFFQRRIPVPPCSLKLFAPPTELNGVGATEI